MAITTTRIGAYPNPDFAELPDWFNHPDGPDTVDPTALWEGAMADLGPGAGNIILRDGEIVFRLASGDYGHTLGGAVSLGYIEVEEEISKEYNEAGSFEIDVGGEGVAAREPERDVRSEGRAHARMGPCVFGMTAGRITATSAIPGRRVMQ
jgi:hypothetical protein